MIKVYFKGETYLDEDCGCCYDIAFEFSDIEGVDNPDQYQSYDYEMYNGSKHSEWDCLVSVFWDLVVDKRQYDHFYDMCESFDNIDEDDIVNMLSDKDIEVVFLED